MTKRFVITGAMGSGKSTVLKLLQAEGLSVIEEPARQILAEQRSIGDEGVPEKNPKFFTQLLLSRAIYQYKQMQYHPYRIDKNGHSKYHYLSRFLQKGQSE